MPWRRTLKLWVIVALLAVPPVLVYSFQHGLCDTTTCGSNWLRPLLVVLVGVGVVGTAFVWWLAPNRE